MLIICLPVGKVCSLTKLDPGNVPEGLDPDEENIGAKDFDVPDEEGIDLRRKKGNTYLLSYMKKHVDYICLNALYVSERQYIWIRKYVSRIK